MVLYIYNIYDRFDNKFYMTFMTFMCNYIIIEKILEHKTKKANLDLLLLQDMIENMNRKDNSTEK